MPVFKDKERNTFYVKTYYTDYTGTHKQKLKRGFRLQRESKEWEHDFIARQAAQPDMAFNTLSQLYLEDKQAALKESKNANDVPLSPGYMQNLVMELSSMFNFAVRFYGPSVNPCHVAGNAIGKKTRSLNFWTKEEFDRFINTFDKSSPYYVAFLMLYYSHILNAEGEKLQKAIALDCTQKELIQINKSVENMVDKITSLEIVLKSKSDLVKPILDNCDKKCDKKPPKPEC